MIRAMYKGALRLTVVKKVLGSHAKVSVAPGRMGGYKLFDHIGEVRLSFGRSGKGRGSGQEITKW